jgi:two-component sensor histidine kinase
MSEPLVTPAMAGAVASLARLKADAANLEALAKVMQSFQARVERIHAVEVEAYEFDFLHGIERGKP